MNRIPAVLLALGVLAAGAAPAFAQARAGGEFVVNNSTYLPQTYPSSGRDAQGNIVVVWDDIWSGYLRGQIYDRAGNVTRSEFQLNTAPSPYLPAIAVSPNGRFVVVWTNYPDTVPGHQGGIAGARFAADGTEIGDEFAVSTYITGYQLFPNVAMDARENFVVTWWSEGQDGWGQGIFGQRFDARGARRGREFTVNAYTIGDQSFQDVSMDAAGNFVVAWTSYPGTDGSGRSVEGQRFGADGAKLGPNFRINAYTTGDQSGVGIAHAPDGSFVVAFSSVQTEPAGDVIGKRYDPSGNPIGAEFLVNTTTAGFQGYPDIAMDAAGNFVVSWWDSVNDGSASSVWARRFRADGTPRGADFLVNTFTTGDQTPNRTASAVSTDPTGNFLVTWWTRATSVPEIYGQRYGGVHAQALQVDRDAGGNGILEPGETVDMRPAWNNVSGGALALAGGLTGITGPAGATYAVADSAAAYGTVANGATAPCSDCYAVSVSNPVTRPAVHWDATATESILPDVQGQSKPWRVHVGESFTDVSTASPFYPFIETILHHDVTAGCGAGRYCPASSASREQMAVFVLVAKEGAGFAPPGCVAPTRFADVPQSSAFCAWVEELARRRVVTGCGDGNYCPAAPVTRAQMAVFVLLTFDRWANPQACWPPNLFADVGEFDPFCRWIEELANRGVVSGCGGGNYCPTAAVTREEMAVFLGRTFGLTLYGP